MEELKIKDTITSLELLEQINLFRKRESDKNELQHKDLLKIIRNEFEEEIDGGNFSPTSYRDQWNREQPMYILTFNQAKQVLVRESKAVRKAVIKYIEELENKLKNPYQVPQNFKEALLLAIKQQEEIERLENKIKENKPRVSFAKAIESASDSILIREFSKILSNENIHIGQNKLYELFRKWGYIFKNSTEPTQKAINQGLFKINEKLIKTVKGDILTKTTMITGKGQIYFLDKIKNEKR